MGRTDLTKDEIDDIVIIGVLIYKKLKTSRFDSNLKHISMMFFNIVGQLSTSEDAVFLKELADEENISKIPATKMTVVQLLNLFSKSKEVCNGTDLENLVKKFLDDYENLKKKQKEILDEMKKDYSEDDISKLRIIVNDLKNITIENPAFSNLIPSLGTTLEIFDKEEVKGLILKKSHFEEVLKALQCAKDLPENIDKAIDNYFEPTRMSVDRDSIHENKSSSPEEASIKTESEESPGSSGLRPAPISSDD